MFDRILNTLLIAKNLIVIIAIKFMFHLINLRANVLILKIDLSHLSPILYESLNCFIKILAESNTTFFNRTNRKLSWINVNDYIKLLLLISL